MKIELKKLIIKDFKGIKNLEVVFENDTIISGKNKSGKSTIYNAWTWLMFGKDQFERKDYEIKPKDKKGNVSVKRVESSVYGEILVDGVLHTLKRVYKEKWAKKSGSSVAEYVGNETEYTFNNVPMTQKVFNQKIEGFISESNFKILTNPSYFSLLKSDTKRSILTSIIENPSVDKIIDRMHKENISGTLQLSQYLNERKSFEEIKAITTSLKKKANEQLLSIPPRIDENNKLLVDAKDVEGLPERKLFLEAKIQTLQKKKESTSTNSIEINKEVYDELVEIGNKKNALLAKIQEKETGVDNEAFARKSNIQSEINIHNLDLNRFRGQLELLKSQLQACVNNLSKKNTQIEDLRNDYQATDQRNFDTFCPTCKREYDVENVDVAERLKNFRFQKSNDLEKILTSGTALKEEIKSLEALISSKRKQIESCESDILRCSNSVEKLNERISKLSDEAIKSHKINVCVELVDEVELLNQRKNQLEIAVKPKTVDLTEFNEELKKINEELDSINASLLKFANNESHLKRIDDLIKSEKEFHKTVLHCEETEFAVKKYELYYIEAIEIPINSMFKNVSFKLFENLINGVTTSICETLVEGINFPSANTAGQINAGIEIINVLSKHLNIFIPLFVDNAESVNDVEDTSTQIIQIVVSKEPLKVAYF